MNNFLLSDTPQKQITPIEQYILRLSCSLSLHLGLIFSPSLYSLEIFHYFLEVTPLSCVIKYRQYTIIEVRVTDVSDCILLVSFELGQRLLVMKIWPVGYFQIRCIALRVLQTWREFWVFLFVNHLSGPHVNSLKGHGLGPLWLVDFDSLGLSLCYKPRH